MNYYIINNASRAASYGIGTYVRQLTDILVKVHDVAVFHIDLYSDTKEFCITVDDVGVTHYAIPAIKSHIETEAYCRTTFYLLSPFLKDTENNVFHFNYFQHYSLALAFKAQNIRNQIYFTVHYFNWCFELKGNTTHFRESLRCDNPDEKQMRVKQDFTSSRTFLRLADKVIPLSRFCQGLLQKDYGISSDKLHLVYNGIGEGNVCTTNTDSQQHTILYVGRLDEIKGVKYLVEAFRKIIVKHPEMQLVLVGDGDYNECLNQAKGIWGNITFTGRINKDELQHIYERTAFGVLPSFHEQCSYAAIEFMMHGIPFIGTDSTGLNEMLDCIPELRTHIAEDDFSEETFVDDLTLHMDLLLNDHELRKRASRAMSEQYERSYTKNAMSCSMNRLIEDGHNASNPLSNDFLYELDEYMISLIHNQPDIDADFYGIAGIGVYLWWRTTQLDVRKDEARIYKIKEYLIYWIDWLYVLAKDGSLVACCKELAFTLQCMKEAQFYITKIQVLTDLLQCPSAEGFGSLLPQDKDIQANAVRMANTKI